MKQTAPLKGILHFHCEGREGGGSWAFIDVETKKVHLLANGDHLKVLFPKNKQAQEFVIDLEVYPEGREVLGYIANSRQKNGPDLRVWALWFFAHYGAELIPVP